MKDLKDITINLLVSALEQGKRVIVSGDREHAEYEPTEYYLVSGETWVYNQKIGRFAHPHVKTAVSAAVFIERICSDDCCFCIR